MKKFVSLSLKDNQKIVEEIFKKMSQRKIFLFEGILGSGKTTLIKQLAKKLKIKENLVSPTFILWQKYKFGKNYFLNHIDLYRVKAKDILKINLKKELENKNNFFFIEWGEKIKPYLKKKKMKFMEIIIKKEGRKRIFILK